MCSGILGLEKTFGGSGPQGAGRSVGGVEDASNCAFVVYTSPYDSPKCDMLISCADKVAGER